MPWTISPVPTHRRWYEAPVAITQDIQLDRADLGDHRLAPGPVPEVDAVAVLSGVFWIAEVFFHLDLETGQEVLLRQVRQQPSRADEIRAVKSRLIDDLRSERSIWSLPYSWHPAVSPRPRHSLSWSPVLPAEQYAQRFSQTGSTAHRLTVLPPSVGAYSAANRHRGMPCPQGGSGQCR